MTSGDVPAPLAEGDFSATPVAHVLLYVFERKLDGTLVVWPEPGPDGEVPKGQDRIRFQGGTPVAGRFREGASSLDRGLLPMLGRTSGPYAFYESDLVGQSAQAVTGHVDARSLITASLRSAAREDAVDAVLRRIGDGRIRLRPDLDLSKFEFNAKEKGFVDMLRATSGTPHELIADFGDAKIARRLLYLLAITKSIEPYVAPSKAPGGRASMQTTPQARARVDTSPERPHSMPPPPLTPPAQAKTPTPLPPKKPSSRPPPARGSSPRHASSIEIPPSPPDGLSKEMRERWDEIAKRSIAIEEENYFQMLGVSRDVSTNALRDAYLGLVKRWHPDRLPRELAALKPFVDRVFHHLTTAHETLTDETERPKYNRLVQDGGGTPAADRKVANIVQAAMSFQKVEVLMKRNNLAEARRLLDEALQLNPEEPDYYAQSALLELQLHPGKDAPYATMLASVDKALAMDVKRERAHFVKATILKRMGNNGEALRHFKKALELNPRNIDAEREIRIAGMRGTSASSKPPPPGAGSVSGEGLLSKLFGSSKKKDKASK